MGPKKCHFFLTSINNNLFISALKPSIFLSHHHLFMTVSLSLKLARMDQNHTQDYDFNQTNSLYASMASGNNKAQQHHHKETVREHALKVAAERALYGAITMRLLVVIFYANLSAMCVSDNSTVNNERSLGKYTVALRNLICPVLKLINQHVSMSKLVPLIELFSFLVITWAVAVILLVGAKFTSFHLVMFLIWSILMLQGSHSLTIGLYLITLGLLFMWSSWKKQSPNGMQKMQQKREPKS